jgi:hypothetical protein
MKLDRIVRLLAGGVVALAVLAVSPAVAAAPDGPFVVYVDSAGADANSGLSPASAVKTLARAQAILAAAIPATDV